MKKDNNNVDDDRSQVATRKRENPFKLTREGRWNRRLS